MKYNYIDIDKLDTSNNPELEKLKKMIKLALNNSNSDEASTAMLLAEKYARKHNIDIDKLTMEDNKNVFIKYLKTSNKKITLKIQKLYIQLKSLSTKIPCSIYYKKKYNPQEYCFYQTIVSYTNYEEIAIILKELFDYLEYIFLLKDADYLVSFIKGFSEIFAQAYSINSLVPTNDDGIKSKTKRFQTSQSKMKINFNHEAYENGKKFIPENERKKLNQQMLLGVEK